MHILLPFLQSREDDMVQTLRLLIEHESPTGDKAANDRLAHVLAEKFQSLTGGTAQLIANTERGDHVRAEWNAGTPGEAPPILILAHFDTVWQQGTLQEMPFRIEDGKAFGPGAFDMKAGLVQGLYALHALQSLRRKIGCKVVFLMTSDEEDGSHTSRALIEAEAAQSRCVLVLEPAAPHGALKTSRKGTGHFQMDIEGRSAHSGLEPEKGRSAIEELARQILYLHGLTDMERGTTLNVGVVSGGTASNVVAARAQAGFDLRVVTQAEADRVLPLILGTRPFLDGTRITISGGLNRPPLERSEPGQALYQMARHIALEEMDFDLGEAAVGGASDGNFSARFAPTLDGLGAVGDGAHARHEHIVIAEMSRRSALLARLIEQVAAAPDKGGVSTLNSPILS